ncbi:conserved hypothetical protein [Perkinsus marinus ATCC 50983]|uniref:Formiminoglutamate deiminase n=1 Tax=Perkinsus marinus (strain ATCC 50983 / TXsc) TaxID=423536 RepID=C5LYH6_PERM5|nr:conserved hypothetical protein [Perkinsus marinus ATCC 50983]EEQ98214.1 conserved hypothetical protein [Perkinsus marinus ATCC 50983]|eukprot:XP_002765497.1 conserved hypothetical protein [Perkinsus marinus ATCC 50983]
MVLGDIAEVWLPELCWSYKTGRFEEHMGVAVSRSGVIVAVYEDLSGIPEAYRQREFKRVAMLPGFVNCHSHAFQRNLRGKGESDYERGGDRRANFWSWREEMYRLVSTVAADKTRFKEVCQRCFSEMRDAGITSVGEFHYLHHQDAATANDYTLDLAVLEAAHEVGIRIRLIQTYYHSSSADGRPLEGSQKHFESQDLNVFKGQFERLQAFVADKPLLGLAVAAHSIRGCDLKSARELLDFAREKKVPFHMHVEEQMQEVEDAKRVYSGRTVSRALLDSGIYGSDVTLVHCTHTTVEDMIDLVGKGTNTCICPTTEGCLADGFPDLSQLRPGDGQVCIGSDCNSRIDTLEELRWLEYAHRLRTQRRGVLITDTLPKTPEESRLATVLLGIATEGGARSLGLTKVGRIAAGYVADVSLVNLDHPALVGLGGDIRDTLGPALVFGLSANEAVCASAVAGKWRISQSGLAVSSVEFLNRPLKIKHHIIMQKGVLPEDPGDVLALARAFINSASPSGYEKNMGEVITDRLKMTGWEVETFEVAPQANNPDGPMRHNIFAYRPGCRDRVEVLFNTHLDTVPPHFDSYLDKDPDSGRQRLRGRGACDTKSLSASMIVAGDRLVASGVGDKVGFLFVVSEETDHSGMTAANSQVGNLIPSLKYVIVGEPTAGKVIVNQKGVVKIRLTAKGVAAHSGYPHLGTSAIHTLTELLHKVMAYPWPKDDVLGDTDVNVGRIEGGQADNALAERCRATLMFRVTESSARIIEVVESLCVNATGASVEAEVISRNEPVNMKYVKELVKGHPFGVAAFNTDISFFAPTLEMHDAKAILFGLGDICDAHCEREYIYVDDLTKCVAAYEDLAGQLLER